MKNTEPVCRKCQILLTEINWTASRMRDNQRICKPCASANKKEYRSNNKEQIKKTRFLSRMSLKFETMAAYGGKCEHCKIDKILFLTIDHINNNGFLDREEVGGGTEFYAYLRRMGYPGKGTQLQVLCHNCNAIKENDLRADGYISNDRHKIVEKEVYIQQPYSISKEEKQNFNNLAKDIYERLNK